MNVSRIIWPSDDDWGIFSSAFLILTCEMLIVKFGADADHNDRTFTF